MKNLPYQRNPADSDAADRELKKTLDELHKTGYLEAEYSSIKKDSTGLAALLIVGTQWTWAHLTNGNADNLMLQHIGFHEKGYDEKPLRINQINDLIQSLLTYCQNNGYPFASVHLDSLTVSGHQLSAKIFVTRNNLITIDSIQVVGDARISNIYLANYLGFRLPSIYREDDVKRISTRIKELPFITEERPAKILFNEKRAAITLFLKKKNASRFDFVLGVLPNDQVTGKLLITGDGQLVLNNAFGRGEYLNLRFLQLQNRSTQVTAQFTYPYLFSIPFSLDYNFNLYKNDTLYLDVKQRAGISYLFIGSNYLKFFFSNEGSSILSLDTFSIIRNKTLPPYLDLNAKFYGIEYRLENLDYRFNPRSGYDIFLNAEAGNRKIKENSKIVQLRDLTDPAYDFHKLYDSVNTSEIQFRVQGNIHKYWPLGSHNVLQTSYQGGFIVGNNLLQNELYRIGGLHTLRGFDEASVLTSQYHIVTLEYHYLLDRNSFFYLFLDGSYLLNREMAPYNYNTLYGFGGGINFATKAGTFTVNYALGGRKNNAVQFRSAKINFGYVNYF